VRAILVTGGTGQVGIELARYPWPKDYQLAFPARSELDLSDTASIRAYLSDRRFDAIVNSGAYTAVDRAESEVGLAWAVNALAPAVLAESAAKAGIPLIQLSTDYVFDGKKDGPYVEDDPVAPLNVYGASKEGGEKAVRTACRSHVILRTSWVVSPHGRNFVKTILRLAAERPSLDVVSDQIGVPTSAADIAGAIATILASLTEPGVSDERYGTFHYCSAGVTSWHGIAERIAEAAAPAGAHRCEIRPIATAAYPTPARRPLNSQLSTRKIEKSYAIKPRDWRAAVEGVLAELCGIARSN
jgi:dTDP-4-dehydrorhamnose reductase